MDKARAQKIPSPNSTVQLFVCEFIVCENMCERTEAARVKSSMERAASTQIYGQSVYLALCCADMLRSRLFHGTPYLNHVLLPLLLLPLDHTLPRESLWDNKRGVNTGWRPGAKRGHKIRKT